MNKVDLIIIVLTYRNHEDLRELFASYSSSFNDLKIQTIVVDAYYNDGCSVEIEKVARNNGADYLRIPNKGYSFGNNYGIQYAKAHYEYDYLIVSNADIEIRSFDKVVLDKLPKGVYGPTIQTKDGRLQNPMYCKRNLLSRKLVYKGFIEDSKFKFAVGIIINKFQTKIQKRNLSYPNKVYQLHGSFLIFSKEAIDILQTVFDENMFLFAEETYLSKILENKNIPSYYVPEIEVFHKEDGSMQFNKELDNNLKESNVYVYEKYYGFR